MSEAFQFFTGETLLIEADDMNGVLAGVGTVTVRITRYRDSRRSLTGNETPAAEFVATARAATVDYPAGWTAQRLASAVPALTPGVYAVAFRADFGGGDVRVIASCDLEIRGAA